MKNLRNISRRGFLKGASAVAAATYVAPQVLGGPRYTAPSDQVHVGVVGVGGRGFQNVRELMKLDDVRITAVADPAEEWDLSNYYYRGVAGRGPVSSEIDRLQSERYSSEKAKQYDDFREMLESQKDIDAVLCATPDHLHAYVSLLSLAAGKHVYCEKPLTHNIAEARMVQRAAKEAGLATQMGNQGHSNEGIRQTVEWIRAGAIGNVSEVHAWVSTRKWNPTLLSPPEESMPVPKRVNWDLWCGPRQTVPFNTAYAPVSWRDFWSFGCGALGDFGCHDLDSALWALDLDMPTRVQFTPVGPTHPEMAPYGEIGYYDFPEKSDRGPIRITWYSGGIKPAHPESMPTDVALPGRGVLFVGDQGVMLCGGAGGAAQIYPESRASSFDKPEPTLRRSPGHHRQWIDAIKGGPECQSNFDYGAKLTEITLLGLLALRTEKVIDWDAKEMKATGLPEADPIIHGDYREGWKLG